MDIVSTVSITDFSILSGIPHVNAEKVSISSEEYMTEYTINRGLLKLLENDIYINEMLSYYGTFLQDVVKPHINDVSIHFPWSDVTDLVSKVNGLSEDIVVRLPINKSVSYIKQLIKNVPRNLNGHIVLFEFCVPESAVQEEVDTALSLRKYIVKDIDGTSQLLNPVFSVSDRNVVFDDFYGGTLIITGTTIPVNDIKNGEVDTEFFDNWVTGMSAGIVINDYQYNMIQADSPRKMLTNSTNQLKSMVNITGTGINVNYAPLSVRNCQCDVFVYNLTLHNNISSSEIFIDYDDYDLPTYEDIVLFWPMEEHFKPLVVNSEYIDAVSLDFEITPEPTMPQKANYKAKNSDGTVTLIVTDSKRFRNPDNKTQGDKVDCFIINEGITIDPSNAIDASTIYYLLKGDVSLRNGSGYTPASAFKNFMYNFADIIYSDVKDDTVKRGITLCFWGNSKVNDTTGMPFISDINYKKAGDNKIYGFELSQTGFKSYYYLNSDVNDTSTVTQVNNDMLLPEDVLAGIGGLQTTTNTWLLYIIEIEEFYGIIDYKNDMKVKITDKPWGDKDSDVLWQINMKVGYYDPISDSFTIQRLTSPKTDEKGTDRNIDTVVYKPQMQQLFDPTTLKPNENVAMFRIGSNHFVSGSDVEELGKRVWRGSLRNFMIFNQIYDNERKMMGYMKQGIQSYYDWNNKGDLEIIKSINSNSAIGSLSAFSVKNLDVNNCYLKQHVKSLKITEVDKTITSTQTTV